MTYGMQVRAADNSVSFDSSSFGGIPINQHKKSDGSYILPLTYYLPLDTTNTIDYPIVINYSDYPGRKIKVIPITSGDTYYQVTQPVSTTDYATIAYFTTTITSDFSPTIGTHGFTRVPTIILVLLA
jgi:hypothetical protein